MEIHFNADVSIFTVPGVGLYPEERKFPPAVLRAAQELKNKAKYWNQKTS